MTFTPTLTFGMHLTLKLILLWHSLDMVYACPWRSFKFTFIILIIYSDNDIRFDNDIQ